MKQKLVNLAEKAMENSYSPYSDFRVGAALLCKDGSIYTGCNIENASFTPTVCAERVAFFKALSEGKNEFCAIAVCGAKKGDFCKKECFPCGVCRQVMSEFCDGDFKIYTLCGEEIKEYTLSQLLPYSFGAEDIEQ